jgi:serine/threonine protein kinase
MSASRPILEPVKTMEPKDQDYGQEEVVNLEEYLKYNGGRLSIDETEECARQILEEVRYLHGKGQVHNDINTQTVLVCSDGIKLSKFGNNGEHFDQGNNSAGHTVLDIDDALDEDSTAPISKPPPHQRRTAYLTNEDNFDLTDPRNDLYAVGLVCYKCLTGRSMPGVARPSELVPGLNAQWDAWLQQAIEPDPNFRFQTVLEMAESIPAPLPPPPLYSPEGGAMITLSDHIETQMSVSVTNKKRKFEDTIARRHFWLLLGTILTTAVMFIALTVKYLPLLWE